MKTLHNILLILYLFLYSIQNSTQQVVCSLDELIQEIYEDLTYNNKLNCLIRFSEEELAFYNNENEENKQKMLKALWTGDCAFEATSSSNNAIHISNSSTSSSLNKAKILNSRVSSWEEKLKENYDLKKGLVDVNGDPVPHNIVHQADMCEIIRALIANGKITGISEDISYIPTTVIDYISCPGGDFQSNICAVNSGSYAEKHKWYIPLDGQSIRINDDPSYEIDQILKQK